MVKQLLKEVFEKLLNEKENDNKTKNGCSVYFVNEILDKRYNLPYFISERTLTDYYNKHVLGKSNKSKEPNSQLKNLMANYLGFEDYSSFEFSKKELSNINKNQLLKLNRYIITVFLITVITIVYGFTHKSKKCIFCLNNFKNLNHHTKENHSDKIPLAVYTIETFEIVSVSKEAKIYNDTTQPIKWFYKTKKNIGLKSFHKKDTDYLNNSTVKPVVK